LTLLECVSIILFEVPFDSGAVSKVLVVTQPKKA